MIVTLSNHPSVFISQELTDVIRNSAGEAEIMGTLHPDQLAIINKQKWFNMFVPPEYGGLGFTLPEVLQLEEGLAWTDGSCAWVVTLCSGAGWFVGFLDPALAHTLFLKTYPCLAGSGAPSGIAQITNEGYVINGLWKYASGLNHATAFTVNCCITKDGQQLYDNDGQPRIRAFVIFPEEITKHLTWNAMGMRATGSHSFSIHNKVVPENRCFTITPKHAVLPHPLYQFPFLPLAETTLAVNVSGMTVRFLDLCQQLLIEKKSRDVSYHRALQHVTDAQIHVNQKRKDFYALANTAWNTVLTKQTLPDEMLSDISTISHSLANICLTQVNYCFPYCGLAAADTNQEINRVWRNIQTVYQHALFRSGAH